MFTSMKNHITYFNNIIIGTLFDEDVVNIRPSAGRNWCSAFDVSVFINQL